MSRYSDRFVETILGDWNQLFSFRYVFLEPFVFRGQSDKSWPLSTSYDRAENLSFSNYSVSIPRENQMLDMFSRKLHLYSDYIPDINDKFEWLAMMQHYGAPTRLLDFTKSLYIAIYFAVSEAYDESTVWIVNKLRLDQSLYELYEKNSVPDKYENLIKDNEKKIAFANKYISRSQNSEKDISALVLPLEPKRYTERLARQQGIFLLPVNEGKTFMENLYISFNRKNSEFEKIPWKHFYADGIRYRSFKDQYKWDEIYDYAVIKIIIPKDMKLDIMNALTQMNITAEILFPGLEGLAKSLTQTNIWFS